MRYAAPAAAMVALCLSACPGSDDTPVGNTTSGDPSSNAQTSASGMSQPCGELAQNFTDPECSACAEASCCTELKTCDDNAACGELISCRTACMSQACVDQCNSEFGSGAADLEAVDACLAGPCATDCPMSTGICDSGFSFGTQECDDCLGDNCCTQLKDCLAEANCNACMTGNGEECNMDPSFQTATTCFQACSALCQE